MTSLLALEMLRSWHRWDNVTWHHIVAPDAAADIADQPCLSDTEPGTVGNSLVPPHTGACPHVVTSPSWGSNTGHCADWPGGPHWAWYTSRSQKCNKNKKMNSRHLRLMADVQFCRQYFITKAFWVSTHTSNSGECVPPWPWPETTLSCCGPSSPSVGALCFVSLKINSNITSLATTTTARHSCHNMWSVKIVRSHINKRVMMMGELIVISIALYYCKW